MESADQLDRLRLDYEQTTELLRTLTDVRFKLLAFVPTISGAAVGLLGRGASAAELLAVGALGLVATLGVLVYELRNTRVREYALERARALEPRLGLGLYAGEPAGDAGVTGLALVYAAAVGGWTYLVAWGALHAAGAAHAQPIGGIVGAAVAIAAVTQFLRAGAGTAERTGATVAHPDAP